MPKSIKAIECPKCGSTQQTLVRPGFYRCENCHTEYFLDSDDINVNYTVRQVAPPAGPAPVLTGTARAVVVVVLAVGALAITGGLGRLLHHDASPAYTTAPGGRVVAGGVVAGDDDEDKGQPRSYRWGSTETALYLAPSGRPERFVLGNRSYEGVFHDSLFASFFEAGTGAELRSLPLPRPAGRPSASFVLKPFAGGDLYAVFNKRTVYRVDKATHTLTDVTKTLFKGEAELASGVASIEPVDEDEGDGFNVFTNDGRNLTVYPGLHRVYTKDQLYAAQEGFGSLRPGSPTRTAFTFSSKSMSYPDDKLQLVRYQYRDNGGGPKKSPDFSWDDDYGGSGIFTSADPHVKRLITPAGLRQARVLSFSDFTPGRLYFNPGVLYFDADYVLLVFRPTAADDSPRTVQCLNARTAAIVFTTPLPEGGAFDQALRTATGWVLAGDDDTYVLGPDGKLLKHLTQP